MSIKGKRSTIMNEHINDRRTIVGYDYMDVTVSLRMSQTYIDCYENFGWRFEGKSTPLPGVPSVALNVRPLSGTPAISLSFKRDRKILNKVELTRLQRNFDACIKEIETMEKSKTLKSSIVAYSIGVLGLAALAGAVLAFIAGMIPLGIILAIPATAGWALPYFCYTRITKTTTEQVTPFIEQKYDELYEVCEKAHRLLA